MQPLDASVFSPERVLDTIVSAPCNEADMLADLVGEVCLPPLRAALGELEGRGWIKQHYGVWKLSLKGRQAVGQT